jgi:hypothetical protein
MFTGKEVAMTVLVALAFMGSTVAISLVAQDYFLGELAHPIGERSDLSPKPEFEP